jgi:hypothetical protein
LLNAVLNSSCIPQGHKLLVETQDGTKFQGVFHTLSKTTDDNFDVILKMARKLVSSICSDVFFSFCSRAWLQDAEEQVIRDEEPQSLLHIPFPDIVQMYSNEVDVSERVAADGASFSTDSEISKKDRNKLKGRELESASSWLGDGDGDMGLDSSSKGGSWNQFEANKQLFGVESTYDENLYTTSLKKTDLSADQLRKAEQIAAEIEGTVDSNPHVREERGQKLEDDGLTEEDRYSSALVGSASTGFKNRDEKKEKEDGKKGKEGKTEDGEKKKSTLKAPSTLKASAAAFVPSFLKKPAAPPALAPMQPMAGQMAGNMPMMPMQGQGMPMQGQMPMQGMPMHNQQFPQGMPNQQFDPNGGGMPSQQYAGMPQQGMMNPAHRAHPNMMQQPYMAGGMMPPQGMNMQQGMMNQQGGQMRMMPQGAPGAGGMNMQGQQPGAMGQGQPLLNGPQSGGESMNTQFPRI